MHAYTGHICTAELSMSRKQQKLCIRNKLLVIQLSIANYVFILNCGSWINLIIGFSLYKQKGKK